MTTNYSTSLPQTSSLVSNSTVSPAPCAFDDPAFRLALASVYSLVFVLGLVGNSFAFWVFLSLDSSRNSVRVFLINCAASDLLFLACLPFRMAYHFRGDRWTLGHRACSAVGNVFYVTMYMSIVLLGLIGFDRYLRLRGRARGRTWMKRKLRICGRAWPVSWLICGALWGFFGTVAAAMIAMSKENNQSGKCFHYRKKSRVEAYINGAAVLLFWLVFVILVGSYAKIAARLLHVSRDQPDLPNARKYKRTARKSFFVLFLFTVCFGPYHVFRPLYIHSQISEDSIENQRMVHGTNEIMLLFSAFNSCLDPVMYFLLSGCVRKAAARAVGKWLGGRSNLAGEATSLSSTMESRRGTLVPPEQQPNTLTPRTSICVINTDLRRVAMTPLPPSGQ